MSWLFTSPRRQTSPVQVQPPVIGLSQAQDGRQGSQRSQSKRSQSQRSQSKQSQSQLSQSQRSQVAQAAREAQQAARRTQSAGELHLLEKSHPLPHEPPAVRKRTQSAQEMQSRHGTSLQAFQSIPHRQTSSSGLQSALNDETLPRKLHSKSPSRASKAEGEPQYVSTSIPQLHQPEVIAAGGHPPPLFLRPSGTPIAVVTSTRMKEKEAEFLQYVTYFLATFQKGQDTVSKLKRKAMPIERGGIEIFTNHAIDAMARSTRRELKNR